MRYRQLGNTDLRFSEVTFGTGDTAGALVYGDAAEQRNVVGRALDLGVTVFDTSPDYGKGMAEVNLGRVLRELDARDALVLTKVEVMPENLDIHLDDIPRRVRESIDDSLTRLRRDRIDVVLLHNPGRTQRNTDVRLPWTPLTQADVLDDVLTGFVEARDAGKVGQLGLSCERAEVPVVGELLKTGEFRLVNAWYNLANPTAGMSTPMPGVPPQEDYTGLFDVALANEVGVAVIRPLAGGALTSGVLAKGHEGRHQLSNGWYSWHPEAFEPEMLRGRRFAFLDRAGEQTISEAAWRFVLQHPAVTTVIGGFSDPVHIDEAVRASEAGPLSADDLAAILRVHDAGFLESERSAAFY